jgi:hypothetical protein
MFGGTASVELVCSRQRLTVGGNGEEHKSEHSGADTKRSLGMTFKASNRERSEHSRFHPNSLVDCAETSGRVKDSSLD